MRVDIGRERRWERTFGDEKTRKCICQRWAIIDKKTGRELGTLGWYTNSSKQEVIDHATNNGIEFEETEDVRVVEQD